MGIIDNAMEVADLVKKYNDLDLYQKIVDLQDEIFQLREENLSLRNRLKELEFVKDVSSRLRRDGNVYRLKEFDDSESGPYCMTCWDADRKLVNLIVIKVRSGTRIKCNRCYKNTGLNK
ncbi:MAG: hypothetical protein ACP5R6_00690 [Chlorobaculum sp.]